MPSITRAALLSTRTQGDAEVQTRVVLSEIEHGADEPCVDVYEGCLVMTTGVGGLLVMKKGRGTVGRYERGEWSSVSVTA